MNETVETRKLEKLKLMQELGLETAADTYAEKNALTTLKFRPITMDKIRTLLTVEYKAPLMSDIQLSCGLGLVLSLLIVGGAALFNHDLPFKYVIPSLVLSLFALARKTNMDSTWVITKPLVEWEHDLPYGALLAVKEAKEQGYKNFQIAFPVKEDSMARLKADPIIFAYKKKLMYNIFAWDDGKVYE